MTLAQTPSTRYYQGWRYDFDATRHYRRRWVAERRGVTIAAATEAGMKGLVDEHLDQLTTLTQGEAACIAH